MLLFVRPLSVFGCSGFPPEQKKGKRGAPENKNGGNEWARPPTKKERRETKKYKSPPCRQIPPCRPHPTHLLITILIPANLTPRSKSCSLMRLTLPTAILSTIGVPSTQRRHLLYLASTIRGLNAASSMRRLLFGGCQRCAHCRSRCVIAFSTRTIPIPLLWSIGRGEGKTHILRTLGVIKQGIVMIFILLLTLLADVMHIFVAYNPTWGNVGVYHLDEMIDSERHLFALLLRSCSSMRRDTSSTFFVFLSPKFLTNHCNALEVFLACTKARTLHVIAMDKAHIQVQHGTSFRDDIGALRANFFERYSAINREICVPG